MQSLLCVPHVHHNNHYIQTYDCYTCAFLHIMTGDLPFSGRLIVAPMVDQSELPFRMLCRSYGAEVCFTPMLHAALFFKSASYRRDNFTTCSTDRPLVVQFCANDPDIFAACAKLVEEDCDAVDLNLGCPQGIARKGHYGSFLQDDWPLLTRMITAASQAVTIPISCKIRIFPEVEKTIQYAQMLVDAGAKLLTVHGRTRDMKGATTGLADWSQIRAVKQNVSVPVYANGNIQFPSDIANCFDETSVDGVMSAEGLLYNPSLFSSKHIPCWTICDQYIELFRKYPTHLSHAKAHFFRILHHVFDENPGFRDSVTQSRSIDDLKNLVDNVRQLYEKSDESQVMEMTTLPVPLYLSQPYFRRDRVYSLSLELKRPVEISEKESESKRVKPDKKENRMQSCISCCSNARGMKCCFSMCKSCCFRNRVDDDCSRTCDSHDKKLKSKSDKKKGKTVISYDI